VITASAVLVAKLVEQVREIGGLELGPIERDHLNSTIA
jgi:hypothetical protein